MLGEEEGVALGVERGGEFVAEGLEDALVLAEDRRDGLESAGGLEVEALGASLRRKSASRRASSRPPSTEPMDHSGWPTNCTHG